MYLALLSNMDTLDFCSIGSAHFLKFMPFILKWECSWPEDQSGQYSNDPDDPGGETKWGIDKRSSPDQDIKNLTLEKALQIYYTQYWQANGCENMYPDNGLAEVYMNACVNCGAKRAVYWLFGVANNPSLFLDRQETYYKNLADENAHLSKYLKGWLNRTSDLRTWIANHVPSQNASLPPQSVA
jgi:lysozyme family protein